MDGKHALNKLDKFADKGNCTGWFGKMSSTREEIYYTQTNSSVIADHSQSDSLENMSGC